MTIIIHHLFDTINTVHMGWVGVCMALKEVIGQSSFIIDYICQDNKITVLDHYNIMAIGHILVLSITV